MAAFVIFASIMQAQDVPKLAVTPSTATVLVGESRYFRAVGADGQAASASFVRWDSSSENAAINGNGTDVEVEFREQGDYVIRAYSPDGSASATVRVLNLRAFPVGAKKWTIESFPGCRTIEVKPFQPKPTREAFAYMREECPRGHLIRAFTSDGRENWRTWLFGEKEIDLDHPDSYEPKSLLGKSICDNVKPEMSRDDVLKVAESAKVQLPDSERSKDVWTFEEGAGECRVTFKDGKVAKKQKIIGN